MTAERVGRHLGPDEPLNVVGSGTLLDDSGHQAVSIGMTDRRFLCVSEAETFVTVGYDEVSSVRTRRRTRTTVRGADHRLLMAIGALLAVVGFTGVIALESGLLPAVFALLMVGSVAAAASIRRDAPDKWDTPHKWDALVEYASGTVDDIDGLADVRRTVAQTVADADDRLLLVGSAVLGILAFVGVALLATHALVPVLALATVGGVALVEYAYRRRTDFGDMEVVQRRERILSIDTTGGRTVDVRVDPDDDIDRELCRAAYADRPTPSGVRSTPK